MPANELPTSSLEKLIECLDTSIKANMTTIDIEAFDMICDALDLKPTDKDVVEAFMFAGWRVKLEFSERSLAMNGWLIYYPEKDRRLQRGVAA